MSKQIAPAFVTFVVVMLTIVWWTFMPREVPATALPAPAVEMCAMGMYMGSTVTATILYMPHAQQQNPPTEVPSPPTPAPAPSTDPEDPDYVPPATHTEPTEYCTPHKGSDGKPPCMCTMDAMGQSGCREGKREVEVQHCNAYCWKNLCHCCRS